MITLSNKTSVALLITLMKQNYNKSWWTMGLKSDHIVVGMHLPTGEVAYYIPDEYIDMLSGMINLPSSDLQTTAFGDDSAERLLEWSKTL